MHHCKVPEATVFTKLNSFVCREQIASTYAWVKAALLPKVKEYDARQA